MYPLVLLTALVLCSGYTNAQPSQNSVHSNSQTVLNSAKYIFRDANKEDIDDITIVLLDAFSPGAAFQYIRPEYQRYKEYAQYCLRTSLEEQWGNIDTETTFVKVVAVPETEAYDGRNERVVALGIWRLMTRNDAEMGATESFFQALHNGLSTWGSQLDTSHHSAKYNCSADLDVNQTRAADLHRQLDPAMIRYIEKAYPKQLYLDSLATHPDWDGNGFAAQNLYWGIEFAKSLEEPVTLIATPVGYPLYDDIGFRSLKNVSITTLDGWGGGALWLEVMEYS